jgi:hypothetical protein
MNTRHLFLLLALLSCIVRPAVAAEPLDVSMIQLIANPKDYDGKLVRVGGFMNLEFDGNAIYLHQDDYKHNITKNGLGADVSDDIRKKSADFDLKYVVVVGTFNAQMTGHLGLWSGSIQKITRCMAWPERTDKR